MKIKAKKGSLLYGLIPAFLAFMVLSCEEGESIPSDEAPGDTPTEVIKVLVAATHGGGIWWFPQGPDTGYDPAQYHQGTDLVNHLNQNGFEVHELGRDETVTEEMLLEYPVVVRAGGFEEYSTSELAAYQSALDQGISLVLISDHFRYDYNGDKVAELVGLDFAATVMQYQAANGGPLADVNRFADHSLTQGVDLLEAIPAASAVTNADENDAIVPLAWFSDEAFADFNFDGIKQDEEPNGLPYMGILEHPTSRIFFITDINKLQTIPQNLSGNLALWMRN